MSEQDKGHLVKERIAGTGLINPNLKGLEDKKGDLAENSEVNPTMFNFNIPTATSVVVSEIKTAWQKLPARGKFWSKIFGANLAYMYAGGKDFVGDTVYWITGAVVKTSPFFLFDASFWLGVIVSGAACSAYFYIRRKRK